MKTNIHHKGTNGFSLKNEWLLSLTIAILLLFISVQSFGQSFVLDLQHNPMSFTNAQRTVKIDKGSNGTAAGSVHRYDNVITKDGITVYALMTIMEVNNATITNFDDDAITGEQSRFQPRIGSGNGGGYVTYQLEFFNTANNASVFIYNYSFTAVDIDGDGNNREYVEVGGYTSYKVDHATQLTISTDNSTKRTKFYGRSPSLDGITFENTACFIANYLNANNKMTFTLGQSAKNTERYYSVQMGVDGGAFTTPVVVNNPLPIAVDDIGATLNSSTGGIAVPNVLTNDLYNGLAIVPSAVNITLVTAASNSGVVLNTSTGQVTVAPGTPGGTYTLVYQISMKDNPANVDVATVTCKVLQADLSITKTGSIAVANGGQNVTYTIAIKNNGPTEAIAASVNDVLNSKLTLISATPSVGTFTAPNWTVGDLANGATANMTIVAKIDGTFSGSLVNTATISSTTSDPVSTNNSATATNTIVALTGPTAKDDNATTNINTPVTINVLSNDVAGSGTIDISKVTFVAGTTPDPSTQGTFTVNTSGVVTFTPVTGFIGTATVKYNIVDGNGLSSQAIITVNILKADLAVTKTAELSVVSGVQNIKYTITVKNNGPNDAQAVVVTDAIPTDLTFLSSTPSVGTYTAPTWTIGTLTNGSTVTLTINAKVTSSTFAGNLVNTATVTSRTADPSTANNTASVTTGIATLVSPTAKDDNATTNINTPVTINVLSNDVAGSSAIDISKVTFVAGTTPDPSTVGSFSVNTSGVVTFTPVTGFIGSTTVKYNIVDGNGLSSQAIITVTILKADLVITKTAELSVVSGVQNIKYTITVKNNGPNDAQAVVATDAIPTDLTFISSNASVGAYAAPTWTIGTLTNGSIATLTINAKVTSSTFAGNLVNTATVTSTTADPSTANNAASVTTAIATLVSPTAKDDNATTNINTPVTINVLTNDVAGSSPIVVTAVTLAAGTAPDPTTVGLFTVNNTTGEVIFTPVTGFIGTATVKYNIVDGNGLTSQATITVNILKADLAITKTATIKSVNADQIVTYTITVKNNGPNDALAVTATDALPTSLTLLSSVPSTGTTFTAPTWTIGTLANGATATLTIDAKVSAAFTGNLVNTATVTSTTGDPTPANNTSTVTTPVTAFSAPDAIDDNATTNINMPVTINVLANDVAGSSPIVITSVSFVQGTAPDPLTKGTFTVDATTGIVTFTPVAGFLGTATINYKILDGIGLSDVATITVSVIPALINNFPSTGFGTLAFEDLWPSKGDYDFNDLVIDYKFEIKTNANNFVDEVKGTFVIKAFGASLENGFGFQLPAALNANDLTVTGYDLTDGYITLNSNGTEANQAKPTIIVYDNAFKQMKHPGIGIGVNTDPAAPYVAPKTLVIDIVFKPNTYIYSALDISNFNPFLIVNKVRGVEVHLPNYAPTSLANTSLLGTGDDNSKPSQGRYYKTANNLPWAINIYEKFDYPIEKSDILQTHLHFGEWATSGGTLYPDWYQNRTGYRNTSLIYPKP